MEKKRQSNSSVSPVLTAIASSFQTHPRSLFLFLYLSFLSRLESTQRISMAILGSLSEVWMFKLILVSLQPDRCAI